jgi:hypothetical protein
MDFDKVLADLHEQLRNLDLAIESLERLENGGPRRRGRPPNSGVPSKGTRKTIGEVVGSKKRG